MYRFSSHKNLRERCRRTHSKSAGHDLTEQKEEKALAVDCICKLNSNQIVHVPDARLAVLKSFWPAGCNIRGSSKPSS